MRASISVDPQDVRAVLGHDPGLLGPNHELVHVRKIHHPGETGRGPAVGDRVRKQELIPELQVPLIDRLPFGVVGWMLPPAGRQRAALAGRAGPVEHRTTHHSPDPDPVRKEVAALATHGGRGEQHADTCNPEQLHGTPLFLSVHARLWNPDTLRVASYLLRILRKEPAGLRQLVEPLLHVAAIRRRVRMERTQSIGSQRRLVPGYATVEIVSCSRLRIGAVGDKPGDDRLAWVRIILPAGRGSRVQVGHGSRYCSTGRLKGHPLTSV